MTDPHDEGPAAVLKVGNTHVALLRPEGGFYLDVMLPPSHGPAEGTAAIALARKCGCDMFVLALKTAYATPDDFKGVERVDLDIPDQADANLPKTFLKYLGQARRACFVNSVETRQLFGLGQYATAAAISTNDFEQLCLRRQFELGWPGNGKGRLTRSVAPAVCPPGYAGGLCDEDIILLLKGATPHAVDAERFDPVATTPIGMTVVANGEGVHAIRMRITPNQLDVAIEQLRNANVIIVHAGSPDARARAARYLWLATQLPVLKSDTGTEAFAAVLGRSFKVAMLGITNSNPGVPTAPEPKSVPVPQAWEIFDSGFARCREAVSPRVAKTVEDLLLGSANTPYGRTDLVGFLNARMRSGAPIGFAAPCWFPRGERVALVEAVACFLLGNADAVELARKRKPNISLSCPLEIAITAVVARAVGGPGGVERRLVHGTACPTCLTYARRGGDTACCEGCRTGVGHTTEPHRWLLPARLEHSGGLLKHGPRHPETMKNEAWRVLEVLLKDN